jgi:DnaK suppressor protein
MTPATKAPSSAARPAKPEATKKRAAAPASGAKKVAPAAAAKTTAKASPVVKKGVPAAKKAAPAPSPAKRTPAKAAAPAPAKKAASAAPSKKAAPAPAKKAPAKAAAPAKKASAGPYAGDAKFLEEQRQILLSERTVYQEQAEVLKAEADSLAQEREPGDVQFDEESGEGGTVTVDRERDLALSAQASAAVEEIEEALARIENKTYGSCERCHQPILKARLRALPYARLCVACKSGGLSSRR